MHIKPLAAQETVFFHHYQTTSFQNRPPQPARFFLRSSPPPPPYNPRPALSTNYKTNTSPTPPAPSIFRRLPPPNTSTVPTFNQGTNSHHAVRPTYPPPPPLSHTHLANTPIPNSWLGREPEKLPNLSAGALARSGEQRYSPLDDWHRTPHAHEQLAVYGRSWRSDRVWEREREMERRRAEERKRR